MAFLLEINAINVLKNLTVNGLDMFVNVLKDTLRLWENANLKFNVPIQKEQKYKVK